MNTFSDFLFKLGELHDCTISEISWKTTNNSISINIEDIMANFRGLPEYTIPYPGIITLNKVKMFYSDINNFDETLWMMVFTVDESKEASKTVEIRFLPAGKMRFEFSYAVFPDIPPMPNLTESQSRFGNSIKWPILLPQASAPPRRPAADLGCRVGHLRDAQAGFYKPRPEPYSAVLARLGTDLARTLFVAGSPADVPGATRVGMPVFWHNRGGLPFLAGGARPFLVADTLHQLLDLV